MRPAKRDYQRTSSSVQALNDIVNHSNVLSSRLSPQSTSNLSGPLSRNEHRLSMLDLGFGKLESYTKLEKLGEGKIQKYIFFMLSNNEYFFTN